MKRLCAVALFASIPLFSHAEGPDIAEHKKMVLENIDGRIANLNRAKECVGAAQTKDAMKACHEQLQNEQKNLRLQKRGKK